MGWRRRGVVRHGRALVPGAAAEALRGVRAGGAGVCRERARVPSLDPVATGLEASRQRRQAAQAARRRRLATRTVPAVALVLGSATMLPIAGVPAHGGGQDAGPLQEDPPSLTFRLDLGGSGIPEAPFLRRAPPP